MRFLTRCAQPVVCLLPCLFLPVFEFRHYLRLLTRCLRLICSFACVSSYQFLCLYTSHDAPYCWFSMNQRTCGEGWLVFGALELLRFKPILSKGFLKLLAALQCYWWWKWSSETLWATLIRLWLHSLSCYCWTMKLSLQNPLGFKDWVSKYSRIWGCLLLTWFWWELNVRVF